MKARKTLQRALECARPLAGAQVILPMLLGLASLGLWELLAVDLQIPRYVLPPPSAIAQALIRDYSVLLSSALVTVRIAAGAFGAALILGVGLGMLFVQSKIVENSLLPYMIVLQVTPIMAIAPLIMIWVGLDRVEIALLVMATIVAFFPILSNVTLGLKSVDHNLLVLFDLYHASRWQRLRELQIPTALPHLIAGAKISGGFALIGAVVAEFVAGAGAGSGLAWRVMESGNRLDIARMFAALALLTIIGLFIFAALSAVEQAVLGAWHDSARSREI